jgi:hypothetical protein
MVTLHVNVSLRCLGPLIGKQRVFGCSRVDYPLRQHFVEITFPTKWTSFVIHIVVFGTKNPKLKS